MQTVYYENGDGLPSCDWREPRGQPVVHQADTLVHELVQGVEALELLAGQAWYI